MDSLATAISVALQYGVPVESLVNKFAHQRFEPMGMTTNRDIPFAKSLVDYIFRWLGMEFIPGYREANAPQRSGGGELKEAVKPQAVKEDNGRWSTSESGTGTGGSTMRAPSPSDRTTGGVEAKIVDRLRSTSDRPGGGSTGHSADSSGSTTASSGSAVALGRSLDQCNAAMQSDAPACDVCGAITVRNGTCYKCMNCGNSMGCS
jgi:ribonucleoside-diphosphate reductase alpha chain